MYPRPVVCYSMGMSEQTKSRRSPRASARRAALIQIMNIRETLDTMRGWWTTTSKVYVSPEDRKPGENLYYRPREVGEYPEAQRRYWHGTVTAIDKAIQDLQALREHCVQEYHNTPE